MWAFITFVAILISMQVHAEMVEVPFTPCDDVENLLGVQKIFLSPEALKYGILVSKVEHTPTVKLDGPAFLVISIGPFTFLKDVCNDMLLNPDGIGGPYSTPPSHPTAALVHSNLPLSSPLLKPHSGTNRLSL